MMSNNIKRKIVFISLFINVFGGLIAQTASDIIAQAINFLDNEQYQQVISFLSENEDEIIETDIPENILYFNLILAEAYMEIEPLKAIEYFIVAKENVNKLYGKNSEEYLSTNYKLMVACSITGNHKDAIKYGLEQKEIIEHALGKDNLTYAKALYDLAVIYDLSHDYSTSRKLLIECLGIRERLITDKTDDNYNDLIITIKNIAECSYNINDFNNAEKYYLDFLEKISDIQGKNNIDYAVTLIDLGKVFRDMEKYHQAEEYMLNSKSIFHATNNTNTKEYASLLGDIGSLYFAMHNYKKAIESKKESIDIYERVYGKDNIIYNQQLISMGISFYKMSRYSDAENYYLEALNYMENHKDIPSEKDLALMGNQAQNVTISLLYTLYNHLGDLYLKTRSLDKAEFYLNKLLSEQDQDPFHRINISAIYSLLGEIYYEKRDFTRSEEFFLLALKECNENTWYRVSTVRLSKLYLEQGNVSEAETTLLDLVEKIKRDDGTSTLNYILSVGSLSLLYQQIYQYEKAEELILEEKILLSDLIGVNNANYASISNNLGTLYLAMERYEEAESAFIESVEIHKNISGEESLSYTIAVSNLANFYQKIGNLSAAKEQAEKSLFITKELLGEHNLEYATSMRQLASINLEKRDSEKAKENMQTALNILINLYGGEDIQVGNTLLDLGYLYLNLEDFQVSLDYYNKAFNIFQKIYGESEYYYAYSIERIGYLNLLMGNTQEAERIFKSVLEVIDKDMDIQIYNILVDDLISLYLSINDCKQADDYIKENQINTEKIFADFSFLSSQERSLYWDRNRYKILKNYLQSYKCPSQDNLKFAYNNILFEKGLLLRYSNIIQEIILETQDSLLISQLNELTDIRGQIMHLRTNGKLLSLIEDLEKEANEIDKKLTATIGKDIVEKEFIDWKSIQSNLLENEVAIEFLSFPNLLLQRTDSIMYCALLLRKDSECPEFIPLFEKKDISSILNIQHLNEQKIIERIYTSGNPKFFNGNKLYELLWKPLEKYLDGIETVYYSPSGILNKISFGAIPVDSVVLSDKYNLRLVSSTREVVSQKRNAENQSQHIKDATIYGGIIYSAQDEELLASAKQISLSTDLYASRFVTSDTITRSGWNYLPGTEQEAKEIETILHQSKIPNIKYIGVTANEESFKQLSNHSPELIHIATHGFFLEDERDIQRTGFMRRIGENNKQVFHNPLLRSGLLMAGANRAWINEDVIPDIEDGILTAEEIANMNLTNTKLVVLSACETGLGEAKNSEGVFGLQRAFKLAGVETIIMSLWKVPDQATSSLMTSFYSNWLNGMTKNQAFEQAQKELRQTYPEPYYWAGFVMMD